MRRIARWMVVVGLAAAAGPARGQDPIDERRGREAAWRFLTQGDAPLDPALTREELAAARARPGPSGPRLGGTLLELRLPRCSVAVSTNGTVLDYDRFGVGSGLGDIRTLDAAGARRGADDRTREFVERSRFDVDALRARALAFLRACYPDFARRRFEEGRARTDLTTLTTRFDFDELPLPGQLAVYPNTASVVMNHETGEVDRYRATNVPVVVTEAPPITKDDAAARALAKYPGRDVTWLELTVIHKQGAPRAVWFCALGPEDEPLVFLIDATDGALPLEPVED